MSADDSTSAPDYYPLMGAGSRVGTLFTVGVSTAPACAPLACPPSDCRAVWWYRRAVGRRWSPALSPTPSRARPHPPASQGGCVRGDSPAHCIARALLQNEETPDVLPAPDSCAPLCPVVRAACNRPAQLTDHRESPRTNYCHLTVCLPRRATVGALVILGAAESYQAKVFADAKKAGREAALNAAEAGYVTKIPETSKERFDRL